MKKTGPGPVFYGNASAHGLAYGRLTDPVTTPLGGHNLNGLPGGVNG